MLAESLRTRGLHAGIRFAPSASFDKEHKRQFQSKCNEGFDWQRQEYADKAWQFQSPQAEGDPRSHMKLTLQPDLVNFEDVFPTGPLDLFFDNLRLALESFAAVFSPRLILGCGAVIRFTAQIEEGDARVFLGRRCLHLEDRLQPLGRPVHAVGLKFLCPPLPGKDKPNWQAEVKVESLIEDVRQLFIEVDARWGNPAQWNLDTVVERFKTAHEFASKEVLGFLRQFEGKSPPQ